MGIMRNPRTTQERRYAQEGWNRAKRSNRNLPEAWDDIIVEYQRSWKKHRKTQYKGYKSRRHKNKAYLKWLERQKRE